MDGVTATDVATVIGAYIFCCANEDGLQEGIAGALSVEGYYPEREVRLTTRDRVDILVGRVGVEVKIAGRADRVLRQLTRYAASDRVDELLLATTRASHRTLPSTVSGKPLIVVHIGGAV